MATGYLEEKIKLNKRNSWPLVIYIFRLKDLTDITISARLGGYLTSF